ncbi:MAG: HEAT repeat domain-containing protein [Thermoguttaceae bacterium]
MATHCFRPVPPLFILCAAGVVLAGGCLSPLSRLPGDLGTSEGVAPAWSPGADAAPGKAADSLPSLASGLAGLDQAVRREPIRAIGVPAPADSSFTAGRLASVTALLELLATLPPDDARCADAMAQLRLDSDLVDVLEYLVTRRGIVLPQCVYRDLLAPDRPDFAAVEQLAHGDVLVRRRAARQLVEDAGGQAPRPLLMHRLADLAVAETDTIVWECLLAAIAAGDDDDAFRLVYAATGHSSAVVRRMACEHLRRHARPRHAAVLLATLRHATEPVACAALAALADCGPDVDPGPVLELLGSRSELVQVAAAVALTRWGKPQGPAALERLALSPSEHTRLRVAQAMGELGLAEFAPTLIRLLEDRRGIRLAALHSLPAVAHCPEAEAPGLHESDRVDAWRQWAARGGV